MYSELNGDKFEEYTTVQGDRWDTISTRAYGDPMKFDRIIQSNPGVPLKTVLPGGIKYRVPVVPPTPNTTDTSKLPPWKQQTSTAGQEAAKAAVPIFTNPSTTQGSFDESFD
jgi:phage tail protein X